MHRASGRRVLFILVILAWGLCPPAGLLLAQEKPAQPDQPSGSAEPPRTEVPEEPSTPAEPKRASASPTGHAAGPHHPPRTGRFVGDHWTPYDPPSSESFPEGSTVHVIVSGDTLWDLAGRYLENPYLWPQIWDVNQYVTDSHWIYPGDPLLIPGKPTVVGEGGPPAPEIEVLEPPQSAGPGPAPPAAPTQVATPEPGMPSAPGAAGAPLLSPLADESDVNCSSFIVDDFEKPDLLIREREDGSRSILATGDIVFLNHGMDAQMSPGDEFTIISNEGGVPHPVFREQVGDRIRMIGRLRVIAMQENGATAEIVHACDAVRLGMHLVPYQEIPIPIATPVDFNRYGVQIDSANAGYIVDVSPAKSTLGDGDVVNIDLGSENGLQPGDILMIFREWGGAVRFDSSESYLEGGQVRAERRRARGSHLDGEAQAILGQMVVLMTQKHTATAKIVRSAREMALGDRVVQR